MNDQTLGVPMARLVRPASLLALALAFAGVLGGCDDANQYVTPLPKVTVSLPEQRQITPFFETTGSAAAVNQTNLVARVAGYVEDIKYKDGSLVTKGTTLFVIEPEPYRVRLEQAKAAKAGAEASLKQLEADYQRQSDLVKRQVVSRSTLESSLAARDSAQSKLDQAVLDIRQAEINLGYTEVKAPFDGIVTARLVSVGELVGRVVRVVGRGTQHQRGVAVVGGRPRCRPRRRAPRAGARPDRGRS